MINEEKEYLESQDEPYLHEIDIRVLKDKNLCPAEKVVLLRYYSEDISTIYEDIEGLADWLNMPLDVVKIAKDGLLDKGYLQEFKEEMSFGGGSSFTVKSHRPCFSKVREVEYGE